MTAEPKRAQESAPAFSAGSVRTHSGSLFAALTADLLARKGEAKPALEPFAHARVAPGSAREMTRGERHDIDRADREEHEREMREHDNAQHSAGGAQADMPSSLSPSSETSSAAPADILKDRARFSSLMNAIAARAGELAPSSLARPVAPAPKEKADETKEGACVDHGAPCPRKAEAAKRAAVAVRFTTHDFLRLRLAAAELETPAHDIIVAALNAYLDAKGVERFDECLCLRKTATICEEIASGAEERD